MKAEALEIAARETDPALRLNRLREYTQAFALRSLHESGAFQNLSFVGGTALRFLFDLPRFSEDLDFSLETKTGYAPEKWLGKLKRDLQLSGFQATITFNDRKTVQSAWVRVEGILSEARLAALPAQKLSIKLEIDTAPPKGAVTETKVVNRFFLMALRHHDLPCLMAGKVRALLTRPYAKGRDWYDLVWYRTRRPPVAPHPVFLAASLAQGKVGTGKLSAKNWKKELTAKLEALDWPQIVSDVRPFLERRQDKDFLRREFVLQAIRG